MNITNILKSVLEAGYYSTLYIVFGLLQLLILFLLKLLFGEINCLADIEYILIANGSSVLFFCSAAACAPVIDHYFFSNKKKPYSQHLKLLVFFLFPFTIVGLVTILFCASTLDTVLGVKKLNEYFFEIGVCTCFIFTVVYSLFLNSLKILSERKIL